MRMNKVSAASLQRSIVIIEKLLQQLGLLLLEKTVGLNNMT